MTVYCESLTVISEEQEASGRNYGHSESEFSARKAHVGGTLANIIQ
jgi:hypothetical protein